MPSKDRTSCVVRLRFLGETNPLVDRIFLERDGDGEGDISEASSRGVSFLMLTLAEVVEQVLARLRLLDRVTRDLCDGVALNCSNRLPKDGEVVEASSSTCSSLAVMLPVLVKTKPD